MDSNGGALEIIARHLALAIQPLKVAVSDLPSFRTFLYRIGWDVKSLPPEYTALGAKIDATFSAIENLGDNPQLEQILGVLDNVKGLYTAIKGIASAPEGVDPTAFLEDVGESLFELLLVDYLAEELPSLYSTLRALGIIQQQFTAAAPTQPSVLITHIQWAEIPHVLTEPNTIPARIYGWGTDDLDFHLLAGHLLNLFVALNWPAYIGRVSKELGSGFQEIPDKAAGAIEWGLKLPFLQSNIDGTEVEIGLALLELPAEGDKHAGLILQPLVPQQIGQNTSNFQITDNVTLELRTGTDIATTLGVLLRPSPDDISVKYPFQPGSALPEAGFGVTLHYAPPSPNVLLGTPGKSRLELKGAKTSFNLDLRNGQLELQLQAAPQDLQVVIAAADLDGFLGQLLGSGEKKIPVTLVTQWSNRTGFDFTGGAGFQISTHPHWSLGPLQIDRLDLGIKSSFEPGHPPDLKAEVTTALAGNLGPVTFTADGIGVSLSVDFAEGNAGPFDISYGFTPPHGLGIRVDAGPIVGGGFLSFEPDKGRYSGALEVAVFSVAVKAIGFVETKLPDGQPGYSFVIVVSAEFNPIQLGLGFTLNGVGGLAALHRSLATDTLQASLLNGSADYILFPKDPIGNAPRIISDLSNIFPPAQGHYVFGPTALIGWGTPTLITAKLAIVLELPSPVRLTLLGQITATLPNDQAAVIRLHVAIFGRLDFAKKLLSIDASLFDSKIAGYTISGDMAVRLSWGDQPNLVVSLGGLNPHFEPPADFPTLKRLTINLSSGDNPRLTCQSYLALTPNTVQFGARAELYAAAAGFNIKGFVSFDCLIHLLPLSLLADLAADMAFRHGDSVLASVHLEASLSGPSPWHIWGKASLSLWLFDVSVPFDVTFGESLPLELPPVDPWPLLQAALQDVRNWTSTLPAAALQATTPAAPTNGDGPQTIEPGSGVTLRQKVLPLNRTITLFGSATPVGPDHYSVDLESVTLNNAALSDVTTVIDQFAAAQFESLSDTEKLSRPSFELMDAGILLGAETVSVGDAVGTDVDFETVILDLPWQPRGGLRYLLPLTHQLTMLENGAAAQSSLKGSGLTKFAPTPAAASKVRMDNEEYVVANAEDTTLFADLTGAVSKGAVLASLASYVKQHPEANGRLEVIPKSEAAVTP